MSMSARTSSAPSPASVNSNRWSTKQLVTMALMCAISLVLSFIEFSIIPAAPFLKLDISLMPCAVVGFAYGPGPGIIVGVVSAVGHAVITGNWVGALMNIIVTVAFVGVSSLLYKKFHTFKGAIAALAIAAVVMIAAAAVANIIVDPIFYGIPLQTVLDLMVWIVVFNIIKSVVIAILTALIYKSISNLITPEKLQVKGR